ncbi:MAG: type II secretion system inner membrane protein GspF [Deltaproteobacteria bacterium]|nr:type II secretion system inner membrane protein GspF [Deltaproteobacteria bacterium]
MPVYEYRALNDRGKKVKGIIDADSLIAARQKLRETSIFTVDLKESTAGDKEEATEKQSIASLFARVSFREVTTTTRQLATLLNGGLPLITALSALLSQITNPLLKKTMAQVKEDVNEGKSLGQSLSRYPQIFSPFYVNMVRAGEASGALDIVLERLADVIESQQALRGKIKAALAYPVFMFFIGAFVLFFLTTFVIPKITGIFEEMHQTLPGITVFLISISSFLKLYWLFIVIFMISVFFVLRYCVKKTTRGRLMWDRVKISVPLFGPLLQKLALARFSRTLGTLLQSGVPLLTALSIVKNVVNNRLLAAAIEAAATDVEAGHALSGTLSKSTFFPPMAVQMISAGEHSGNVETMLYKVAESYEHDVESSVVALTSILEPVMILIMGVFVGFIVVSILLPIFEMNQLIR